MLAYLYVIIKLDSEEVVFHTREVHNVRLTTATHKGTAGVLPQSFITLRACDRHVLT